jgi:hypothetical protein
VHVHRSLTENDLDTHLQFGISTWSTGCIKKCSCKAPGDQVH